MLEPGYPSSSQWQSMGGPVGSHLSEDVVNPLPVAGARDEGYTADSLLIDSSFPTPPSWFLLISTPLHFFPLSAKLLPEY